MNTYYVLGTYLGNYSERPWEMMAKSLEQAADNLRHFFSQDFRAKGTVYVFDTPPVLTVKGDDK